jgi:hypothetical protein
MFRFSVMIHKVLFLKTFYYCTVFILSNPKLICSEQSSNTGIPYMYKQKDEHLMGLQLFLFQDNPYIKNQDWV